MLENAYWIALIPALSLPINLARKFKEPIPGYIGSALVAVAWLWSLAIFFTTMGATEAYRVTVPWIPGAPSIYIGFQIDHLTTMMLLVVTTVSLMVHIYSIGYMHGDAQFNRFYAFLGLFSAAMLGVVLADNFLLLLICWELVGLTSYLLIGFWYAKPSAMKAAKKAFVVTRFGDLGMLIAAVLMWREFGTFDYDAIFRALPEASVVIVGAIAFLLFAGAVGKSAQFPLHVWLPDAMEGPTPVSALIHAATMVAAGVYLTGRAFPLFEYGSLHTFQWGVQGMLTIGVTPLGLVRWLGVSTLFLCATIAVAQNDIKRVLAYSTCSQLGYMMMGIGLGSWVAGLFHLMTHAFFKALLFLGSGSVIHGSGTQDMREMGGLARKMPKTYATYMVGYLALIGFPLFAGFWSKDAILDAAHLLVGEGAWLYMALGLAGAFLTAFYMTRQMWMVFWGDSHRNPSIHAHESPASMWAPLAFLAIPALLIGFVGMPKANLFKEYLTVDQEYSAQTRVHTNTVESTEDVQRGDGRPLYLYGKVFDAPGVDPAIRTAREPEHHGPAYLGGLNPAVAYPSTAVALLGLLFGWLMYRSATRKSVEPAAQHAAALGLTADHPAHGGHDAEPVDSAGFWRDPLTVLGPVWKFLENKWYWDEIYWAVLVVPTLTLARIFSWIDKYIVDNVVNGVGLLGLWTAKFAYNLFDTYVVDGVVNGLGLLTRKAGGELRRMQTGRVQNYAVVIFLGALLLMIASLGAFRLPR